MEKIKNFFSKLGKKVKENGKKLAFWFVLLVVSVTGFFYSFRAKNNGDLVSGSADTVSYNVSFLGSNVYVPLLTDLNGSSYQYGAFSVVCSFNDTANNFPTFDVTIQNVGFYRAVSGFFDIVPFWESDGYDTVTRYGVNFANRSDNSLSSLWSHFYAWIDGRLSINTSFNVVGVRIYTTYNIDPRYTYVSSPCYTVFSYITSITGLTYNFAFPYTYSGYADTLLYEDRYYYFDGFDPSYFNGYNDGYAKAEQDKQQAVDNAYNQGKSEGYNLGRETPTYSFISLLDAVGYSVTKPFASLLNFDLLGTNLLSLATGFISLVIIVKIISLLI